MKAEEVTAAHTKAVKEYKASDEFKNLVLDGMVEKQFGWDKLVVRFNPIVEINFDTNSIPPPIPPSNNGCLLPHHLLIQLFRPIMKLMLVSKIEVAMKPKTSSRLLKRSRAWMPKPEGLYVLFAYVTCNLFKQFESADSTHFCIDVLPCHKAELFWYKLSYSLTNVLFK